MYGSRTNNRKLGNLNMILRAANAVCISHLLLIDRIKNPSLFAVMS